MFVFLSFYVSVGNRWFETLNPSGYTHFTSTHFPD